MRRRWSLVLALALVVPTLVACDREADPDPDQGPPSTTISFGVFGTEEEVAAYQTMVDAYNAKAASVEVKLVAWPDSGAMASDLEAGLQAPDLYMVARRDLAAVVESGRNAPLFDLLEARDVSYGDDFSQPAIEAFSANDDLQCMPYSVSPMVMYVNTDLIDFEQMRLRGLPAPVDELAGWTLEEFSSAAEFAGRDRSGLDKGVGITPTLRSLAPFVYSGGGRLFNDDTNPTSLALSDSVDSLTTTLEVLRNPELTLDAEQLAEATPQEWFERGQLGMIEGFRSLTPELREIEGLNFDVMAMPVVSDPATVGDLTGLCITPGENEQATADFLVHAISDEGVTPVAEAGYVVPANLTVARSEAFLQPDQQPANAGVFNASVDNLVSLPLIEDADELNALVEPLLDELLNAPAPDVAALAAQIDEASRSVLDPDYVPSPSETPSS